MRRRASSGSEAAPWKAGGNEVEEEGVPAPPRKVRALPDRDGARWTTFRDGKDRFGQEAGNFPLDPLVRPRSSLATIRLILGNDD